MTGWAAALDLLGWAITLACVIGMLAVAVGAAAVHRFAASPKLPSVARPPVSVLRPLCGDEPLLDAALDSICEQAYPQFQIVLGVQDPADPALGAVQRLRARFPDRDIAVAIETAGHGPNRKVSNLINMLPSARHDILVFSDSDLHVAPDYLDRVVAALHVPGTGLVTTVCLGLPTVSGPAARLGAMAISHCFLPGALMSRAFGRQDCLGTTMALRRETLARVGGLHALVPHLADDNVLGQLVRRLGQRVGLADTVPLTGVPEHSMRLLWAHEMRWARTIGALEPLGFAASALHLPLFWATLGCLLSGLSAPSIGLFAAAWMLRATAAHVIDRALGRHRTSGIATAWLIPLRDLLSVAQIATSFLGERVVWRGHTMFADNGRAATRGTADVPAALVPAPPGSVGF
jgi:ceramide glucosyltransferase